MGTARHYSFAATCTSLKAYHGLSLHHVLPPVRGFPHSCISALYKRRPEVYEDALLPQETRRKSKRTYFGKYTFSHP